MTENDILKALSTVEEPDFKKDLVTLNMVEDIKIDDNTVSFTVVLTTPACPLKDLIKSRCYAAIHSMINKEVEIKINFTSRTTSLRTDKKDVLKDVKNDFTIDARNTVDPSRNLDALHIQNFFDGIRKGTPLNAEILKGYQSTLLSLLGNIAVRTGTTIKTDSKNGHIINNIEANKYWKRKYQPGWEPTI